MRLGEILMRAAVADQAAIQRGLDHAAAGQLRLGSALIELGLVTSDVIAAALAKQHGVAPASEKNFATIEPEALSALGAKEAHKHCALPLGTVRATQELAIAMRDPLDLAAIDALGFATGRRIRPAAASELRIRQALENQYGPAIETGEAGADGGVGLELDLGPLAPTTPAPAPLPGATEPATPSPLPRDDMDDEAEAPGLSSYLSSYLSSGKNLAILGVGIVALVAGAKFAHQLLQSDVGVSVYGSFDAEHVGLALDLPDTGWLYLEQEDQNVYMRGGVNIKVSVLYRGDDSEYPDDAIGLYRVSGPFPPQLSEQEFDRMTGMLGKGESMESEGLTLSDLSCERSDRRVERTAGCSGEAVYRGREYQLLGYVWFEDGNLISAFFLSKLDLEQLDAEIDEILPSIQLLE